MHFTSISDCETILQYKGLLRKGVYVKQNYPPEIESRRSKLVPILKKAHSLPNYKGKAKLVGDKLVIKDVVYSAEPDGNLKDLPTELNPMQSCQNSSATTLTYFGYASPFSNFYHSDFTLNGKKYSSAEQYIQAMKAETFNDEVTLHKIMKLTATPPNKVNWEDCQKL